MDSFNPLLAPVVALVAWTLLMLIWLAVARFPAMKGKPIPDGARGSDMPPGRHNWPGHNYEHLLEQPTIFYAIVLALVAMGDRAELNLYLAWGYVLIRVVHSLWQSTVNVVMVRFTLFLLATLCLAGLTLHAGLRVLHECGIID
jgi:hypothetical protein